MYNNKKQTTLPTEISSTLSPYEESVELEKEFKTSLPILENKINGCGQLNIDCVMEFNNQIDTSAEEQKRFMNF